MKNNSIRNIFIGIVPCIIIALLLCCNNVSAMQPGIQMSPDLQKALSDPGVIRALAQFVAINQAKQAQLFSQEVGHLSHFTQQRGQLALMERYEKLVETLEKKGEKKEDSLAVKCAKGVTGDLGKMFGGVAETVIVKIVTWSILLSGLYMLPGGRFVLDGARKILGLHSFSTPPAATPNQPIARPGLFAYVGNGMVKGPAYVIRKAVSVL